MKKPFSAEERQTVKPYLIVVVIGLLLYFFLDNISVFLNYSNIVLTIIKPFLLGFAIAYLLTVPLNSLEQLFCKIFPKQKRYRVFRVTSIAIVMIVSLIAVALIVYFLLPDLLDSIYNLWTNIPMYLTNANTLFYNLLNNLNLSSDIATTLENGWNNMYKDITNFLINSIPAVVNLSFSLPTHVINILVGIIISIYVLDSKEKFAAQTKKVIFATCDTKFANGLIDLVRTSNTTFMRFIIGKIIDSAIIGVICFGYNIIADVPYALLVAFIVGLTNIIPFFGPFIGAIPCLLLIVIVDPRQAFWFGIFIFILQQFDGNILGPKILGQSTGLAPFWVIFAILISGGLFGFVGMVLGVPLFAVIYSVLQGLINQKLIDKGLSSQTNDYSPPNTKIHF